MCFSVSHAGSRISRISHYPEFHLIINPICWKALYQYRKYCLPHKGQKSDKQVHVNGRWVVQRYKATWIIKAPGNTGQRDDTVPVNYPDQYIEISANMVPNYAPIWPQAHLFSHFSVFFSLQPLLPSHSSSVRRFGWHTGQLYMHNTNQIINRQTRSRQGNSFETSNPNSSSALDWSII